MLTRKAFLKTMLATAAVSLTPLALAQTASKSCLLFMVRQHSCNGPSYR